MNFQQIWEITGMIIASIGGVGAIIYVVSGFISKRIANILDKKYEQRLNKELERFKYTLEQRKYVTKTQFDCEFEIYRQLSKAFFSMLTKLSFFTESVMNKEDTQENHDSRLEYFKKVGIATADAQNILYENAAFIPESIFILYDRVYEQANTLFWKYSKCFDAYASGKLDYFEIVNSDDKIAIDRISTELSAVNCEVRKYLGNLSCIE